MFGLLSMAEPAHVSTERQADTQKRSVPAHDKATWRVAAVAHPKLGNLFIIDYDDLGCLIVVASYLCNPQ